MLKRKSVLVVAYALPPLLYPQSIQISRLLRAMKTRADVHLVTADETGATHDPGLDPRALKDVASLIRLTRLSDPRLDAAMNRFLPSLAQRPDLSVGWARRALQTIRRTHGGKRFDAIVTFAFPLSANIMGLELKRAFNSPWVAHNSDPWADNPFLPQDASTAAYHQAKERECFSAADNLVFTSEETARLYRDKYPEKASAILALPHTFDPTCYPEPQARHRGHVLLRYIGSFYGARTPKPLLAALSRLPADLRARLKIEFVGSGAKAAAMSVGHQDVVIVKPGTPYRDSLRLMCESDVLLVVDAPSNGESVFFPSKLADYLGAGRPILGVSPRGATARILRDAAQPCVDVPDTATLTEILARIALERAPFWSAPSPEAIAPYHLDQAGQRFCQLMEL